MEYRRNSHHVFSCKYHVVFCPKYRRRVLQNGVDDALKELVLQYAGKHDIEVVEMEVMPDHVHLLLDCPPDMAPVEAVKGIKQLSSVVLRRQFPFLRSRLPTLWTRSSFIATVGSASLETVKAYIENQKQNERKKEVVPR